MEKLDLSYLVSIADGEMEFVRAVLSAFQGQARAGIEKLGQAVQQGDTGEVTSAAHALKGACRSVGAGRLAMVCDELESAGRNADSARFEPLWRTALEEYEALMPLVAEAA